MLRAAISDVGPDWGQTGMLATVAEHDRLGRDRFARLGFRQLPNYVHHGLLVMQRMPSFDLTVPESIQPAEIGYVRFRGLLNSERPIG